MRAFLDRPAVVAAFFDLVDHFPEILADFAAPEVAGLAVEAEAPQLPQTVGVDFGPSVFVFDERVVLGDRVIFRQLAAELFRVRAFRIVHVDAEQLGEDAAEVLADGVLVGDAGTVAGDDVEIAVRPEFQAAAVMTAAGPFEDDRFRSHVDDRRLPLDRESRDARAFRQAVFLRVWNPGHEDVAVLLEFGMECDCVDDLTHRLPLGVLGALELQSEVGLVGVLFVDERENLAPALGHEQAIGARRVGQIKRLLELRQLRKRRLGLVRRRRFRRADHLRRRPRHTLVDAERFLRRFLASFFRGGGGTVEQNQTEQGGHCTKQPMAHGDISRMMIGSYLVMRLCMVRNYQRELAQKNITRSVMATVIVDITLRVMSFCLLLGWFSSLTSAPRCGCHG